jgi:hypothetical protein
MLTDGVLLHSCHYAIQSSAGWLQVRGEGLTTQSHLWELKDEVQESALRR